MTRQSAEWTRRHFLGIAACAAGLFSDQKLPAADLPRSRSPLRSDRPRKKLAVVTTAYHYLSHAYHICGRFLHGYLRHGTMHYPDFAIAGMYVEQQKEGDLSRELSEKHGFKLYADPAAALTLGGDKLAVDGVLLIGEHGDYPYNAKAQKLYPRYELFQKIVEVFRKSGRVVPVFCDKHLSYDRAKAREMIAMAKSLGFPFMAGSSLPVTWRQPELELPLGAKVKEALVATRGEIEIYGFHGLEALQCMVERRISSAVGARSPDRATASTEGLPPPGDLRSAQAARSGDRAATPQQGVSAVTCLEGAAVWKAGDDGVWSWELLEHALGRSPSLNVGDIRDNCRQFVPPPGRPTFLRGPIAFVVEYRDGLRATVLILNGHVDDTTFAARVEGERKPLSTLFYLPPPPGAAFLQALTVKIEEFLEKGRPPYPVERTLLTGGVLDAALESRVQKGKRIETPDLDVRYEAPLDSGFLRGAETNPA